MFRKLQFFITVMLVMISNVIYGQELQEDIDRATTIIQQFKDIPEGGIPRDVLKNAKGLAILNVVKGAFIFSGRVGSGIVVAKTSKGWSAPSAIGVAGGGFGFQFGVEVTDFVIVLNTQDAVDAFSHGNVTLGGNLSIAAGPVGRTAEGGVTPVAAVYSYSRSQGLFAGVSLEGTAIGERKRENAQFYGKSVSAQQLLSGKISPPKEADALYKELNTYK